MPLKFLTSILLSTVVVAQSCPDDFISEMESGAASSLQTAQNAIASIQDAVDNLIDKKDDAVSAAEKASKAGNDAMGDANDGKTAVDM